MSGNEWWRIERGKFKCRLTELTGNAGSQDEGSFPDKKDKESGKKRNVTVFLYISDFMGFLSFMIWDKSKNMVHGSIAF